MRLTNKNLGYLLALSQLTLAIMPAYAGRLTQQDKAEVNSAQSAAQLSAQFGSAASASNMQDAGRSVLLNQASDAASNGVEAWLNQYGTARVSLQADREFSLKNSSADVLFPLYDTASNVFFTQLGARDNDGRVTTNLGLGHRHFTPDWMLGYNAFYDASWNNINQRYGVGVEAWRDYLKLSANVYHGISGWHQSRQHEDYDERPANGWDMRSEAYLPAYPQLGAKVAYEQYYGDNVALLGDEDMQKNPHAFTVGVNYTPVPLVTAGIDVKNGKNGANDTQLNLAMNYHFGVPFGQQLDPTAVAAFRSLAGSRLDLVERSNNIVMDYRKQELLTLAFPEQIRGAESAEYTFNPQVKAKYGVARVELNDAALMAAGGKILSNQPGVIRLQLPTVTEKPVSLSGVAFDRHGNASNVAISLITVTATRNTLTLTDDHHAAKADGLDVVNYLLSVKDSSGHPVANAPVTWSHSLGELHSASLTDAQGIAKATLTSQTAGHVVVTAAVAEQNVTDDAVDFSTVLSGQVQADKTIAKADGLDTVSYDVLMVDATGQPVANQTVSWTTDKGALTSASGTTDATGRATVKLTSLDEGEAHVVASVGKLSLKAPVVSFSIIVNASVTVDKTTAHADGLDEITYTLVANTSSGKPSANQPVDWTTDKGTLTSASATTDANGRATVKLTSLEPGNITVVAKTRDSSVTAPVVSFVEVLTVNVTRDKSFANADSHDVVTYSASVNDAAGKPLANRSIHWATSMGKFVQASPLTDAKGHAIATLTSDESGVAVVSVVAGSTEASAPEITFQMVLAGTLTSDKYEVPVLTTAHLTLSVKDAKGRPVNHALVSNWTVDGSQSPSLGTPSSEFTDANGVVTVKYTPDHAGRAVITATIAAPDAPANTLTVSSTAINTPNALSITSIEAVDKNGGNANSKTFNKSRGPTTAWKGAKFKINTEKGTGNITWTSDSGALSINGDIITINANPGNATLTGTDSAGGSTALKLGVTHWFNQSGTDRNFYIQAQSTCSALGAKVSSRAALTSLYAEWGNLFVYDGWERGYYQTSTAYDSSEPLGDLNNWAFWAETGSWMRDAWGHLYYACGGE